MFVNCLGSINCIYCTLIGVFALEGVSENKRLPYHFGNVNKFYRENRHSCLTTKFILTKTVSYTLKRKNCFLNVGEEW